MPNDSSENAQWQINGLRMTDHIQPVGMYRCLEKSIWRLRMLMIFPMSYTRRIHRPICRYHRQSANSNKPNEKPNNSTLCSQTVAAIFNFCRVNRAQLNKQYEFTESKMHFYLGKLSNFNGETIVKQIKVVVHFRFSLSLPGYWSCCSFLLR